MGSDSLASLEVVSDVDEEEAVDEGPSIRIIADDVKFTDPATHMKLPFFAQTSDRKNGSLSCNPQLQGRSRPGSLKSAVGSKRSSKLAVRQKTVSKLRVKRLASMNNLNNLTQISAYKDIP